MKLFESNILTVNGRMVFAGEAVRCMRMSRRQQGHQLEYPGFVARTPAPLSLDSAVSKVESWKSPFQDIRKSGPECDIYLIRSAQYSGRRRA